MAKKVICLVTLFLFGSWSAHAMEERLPTAENQEMAAQVHANTQENRALENNEREREDREFRNGCFIAGVLVAVAVSNACVIS